VTALIRRPGCPIRVSAAPLGCQLPAAFRRLPTPFLGPAETLEENLELHRTVAPQAPWLGLIAWGEIAPCGGQPEFHNYTYPLAVLSGN